MRKLLLVVFTLLATTTLYAEDLDQPFNLYQIEIIFFEHNDPQRFEAEEWPEYVGGLNTKNSTTLELHVDTEKHLPEKTDQELEPVIELEEQIEVEPTMSENSSIILLNEFQMSLKDTADTLSKSPDQRLILHTGWTQPIPINKTSTPVYFKGGEQDSEIESVISIKPGKNVISANIDMIYSIPETMANKPKQLKYRITRDAKLKQKELYYVDHPIIGMMLLVTPVVIE